MKQIGISVVGVLVAAMLLSACGGTSKPKASAHGTFIAYSKCMRTYGVTNFPDPSSDGVGGIQLGAGVDPDSPAFKSAQGVCSHLLPGGGPGHSKPTAAEVKDMVEVSECMRAHGVTGYPDPYYSATLPGLNPANYSSIEDRGGEIVAIPKAIDMQSPVAEKAAAKCNAGGAP